MDTDDLSNEAYEIIVNSNDISDFLKTELGVLASSCRDQKEYLNKTLEYIDEIIEDPEVFMDDWMLEEPLNMDKLKELVEQIKKVQITPADKKTYREW